MGSWQEVLGKREKKKRGKNIEQLSIKIRELQDVEGAHNTEELRKLQQEVETKG